MGNYNTIIQFACLAWVLANFEPLQVHVRKLKQLPGSAYKILYTGLRCPKCMALWVCLFATQNLFLSVMASVLAAMIDNYISNTNL